MSNDNNHHRNEYLDNPNFCPYCEHTSFSLMQEDNDYKWLWRTWSCSNTDCGKSWTEEYTLTSVILEGDE